MKGVDKKGFTVIEIIVVLAIIVFLVAFILSALGPSREKSRQSTCISNLHQWGTAFALYQQDYDGIIPEKGVPTTKAQMGLPPISYWEGFMKQYKIWGTSVMKCPDTHYPGGGRDNRLVSYNPYYPFELEPPSAPESRGPEFLLLTCHMHNVNVDFANQPSWLTKKLIRLQLDQSIKIVTVPVHSGEN